MMSTRSHMSYIHTTRAYNILWMFVLHSKPHSWHSAFLSGLNWQLWLWSPISFQCLLSTEKHFKLIQLMSFLLGANRFLWTLTVMAILMISLHFKKLEKRRLSGASISGLRRMSRPGGRWICGLLRRWVHNTLPSQPTSWFFAQYFLILHIIPVESGHSGRIHWNGTGICQNSSTLLCTPQSARTPRTVRVESEQSVWSLRTVWSPFPKNKNPTFESRISPSWVRAESEWSLRTVWGQSELSVHLQLPWILNSYFFKKILLIFNLI